jgi:hypothetical protein
MPKKIKVDASETVFFQFEMEVPDDVEEDSNELDELVNDYFSDMTPEQREKVNTWTDDWTYTVEFPYESEVDEDEDDKNGD